MHGVGWTEVSTVFRLELLDELRKAAKTPWGFIPPLFIGLKLS